MIKKVVSGVIIWQKKVLLCLEKVRSGDGLFWFPPGGKVEVGESELSALHRELEEELSLSLESRERNGIKFKPYYRQRSIWFDRELEIINFLTVVRDESPIELLAGQIAKCWCSKLPTGGLISESVETLFIRLRLDGYLT